MLVTKFPPHWGLFSILSRPSAATPLDSKVILPVFYRESLRLPRLSVRTLYAPIEDHPYHFFCLADSECHIAMPLHSIPPKISHRSKKNVNTVYTALRCGLSYSSISNLQRTRITRKQVIPHYLMQNQAFLLLFFQNFIVDYDCSIKRLILV